MQNGDSEVGVHRTYDQYGDKWTPKRQELRNRRFSRDLLWSNKSKKNVEAKIAPKVRQSGAIRANTERSFGKPESRKSSGRALKERRKGKNEAELRKAIIMAEE